MVKLDYQLKHQLFGRNGSLWERQADAQTRTRMRGIVKAAGHAPMLAKLDQVAAGSLNSDEVLIEDAYFRFVDGDFAVVGRSQRDYSHSFRVLEDGTRLHIAYRPDSTTSSQTPVPNELARVTDAFLDSISDDEGHLPTDRDWYLVPIPSDITPIMIEGRDGSFLVSGVDFLPRDGYIVMSDSPSTVLPGGLVRVPSAYQRVFAPNSFVLSAPRERKGTKWLASYAYKTQSAGAFKRAAAEYAGLYVFQTADVILDVQQPNADTTVYVCAAAGAVSVRYPHTALVRNQEVEPGTIISGRFEVVASEYNSTDNLKQMIAEGWDEMLSLDGILPVQGLAWDGKTEVLMDSVATDPTTGTPHLRAHFTETAEGLNERLWEWQRLHEQQTGVFLYDGLGTPTVPTYVDFWELLENFYGTQLLMILAEEHTPTITERLRRFIAEHRPQATTALVSLEATFPVAGVATDEYGFPLVDSDGDYVVAVDPELCVSGALTISGHVLSHDWLLLTHTTCEEAPPDGARIVLFGSADILATNDPEIVLLD